MMHGPINIRFTEWIFSRQAFLETLWLTLLVISYDFINSLSKINSAVSSGGQEKLTYVM
jgi:hypothetical protein